MGAVYNCVVVDHHFFILEKNKLPKLIFFDHFSLNVRKQTKSTVILSEMQKRKKEMQVFLFFPSCAQVNL